MNIYEEKYHQFLDIHFHNNKNVDIKFNAQDTILE